MRLIRDFTTLLVFAGICTTTAGVPASFDLGRLHGRVVYVDFWASWCAPCRQSFPWMQSMNAAYKAQGLSIIAVNLDRNRADADAFLRGFPHDFDVQFDPEGALAEQFGVEGMPTGVLIDRHGNVRFTHIGFRAGDRDAYAAQIRQLLAEP